MPFARQRCASNNDQGGGHVESRNCRGHCFRPFCRVLQPTQHLACALFDVGVDGSSYRLPLSFDGSRSQPCPYVACLDRKQVLTVYRQIADDLTATLEHLATSPRCDIGRQGCNEAMSAALLPTKKQLAAATAWTETKPDEAMTRYPVAWRQAVENRDYLIRTIAFEASGEPAMAKVAVAYVVLNRKKSGRWGDNIKAVVTHPGQFEPWATKRREIETLSSDDPRYQSAAIIADAVLSGRTPDPTAGATHFLNPTIVRERRSGELPSWARGEGLLIGSHTFYFPEGDEPNHGLND